ncbi:uncharacterized protein BCR38DRAFT_458827 [Pseudomassariella vexata]|uniref:Glucose-methanol-choline oxidoreductase C-terminal domain-containing protein n=1 Tax=Pseudomassariella vexata TaxID=1141098 RepID=A0A1Y2DUE2_9PEZI|nr:uncharacterized protein BCR38DRAFT_458827 [Pseudomassariella vexata]ORY62255.1 hypothetical protein BCR38DRAFT_458827 [Pseudomassariella vexata]
MGQGRCRLDLGRGLDHKDQAPLPYPRAVFPSPAASKSTYDYIVFGSGPAGIIAATRVAETNKNVLLKRGTANTVSTGATNTLSWNDTPTPICVPALASALGSNSLASKYACANAEGTSACVLGGAGSFNYMVYVHPLASEFDDKWPTALLWYFCYFLDGLGWASGDQVDQLDEKTQVYSYPNWDIENQMRADEFTIRLSTKALRVVCTGSSKIISLAAVGKVVLAAWAWITPGMLFNSGITLTSENEWLDLPAGQGMKDHAIFTANTNLYNQESGILMQGMRMLIFWMSNRSCSASDTGVFGIKAYLIYGAVPADPGRSGVVEEKASVIANRIALELVNFTIVTAMAKSYTSGNHWVGSAVIGGGSTTSAVDTNAKVHGMDNLYIVDANFHADLPSGNSQAIIMVVAEAT